MKKSTMLIILTAAMLILFISAHEPRTTPHDKERENKFLALENCNDKLKQWQSDHGSFEGAQIIRNSCTRLESELHAVWARR